MLFTEEGITTSSIEGMLLKALASIASMDSGMNIYALSPVYFIRVETPSRSKIV